ncbi:hypothetical protein B0H14DRAFT_3011233 [Mycena olivaceomarginata]|nr:hypothetical protein B0H14DRAFT_3011233 [Mycena olivaceomarginata]
MRTFDCRGWLTVWAYEDSEYFIRIRHQECHEKYVSIDLPEDVKSYINQNPKMRSFQLWKEILKSHPRPAFSQKAVYNLWNKQQQTQWRRHDDELESAKLLLKEFSLDPKYELEPIDLPDDGGGYTAIAFALPSLILALDSTFNTTKSGFECFSLLGEVFGSGLPLGFLLIKSDGDPEPNQKEQYIRSVIRHFVEAWNLRVRQCLSDKDITEINALLGELPDDVKYQICFWHSIRIVKGRMSVLARRPAPYDVEEAVSEFDWIDPDFVPIAQLKPELQTTDCLKVAQSTIPAVKLRFSGQTSEVSAPPRPKVIIKLNNQPETARSATNDQLDRLSDSLDDLERLLESLDDDDEDLSEDFAAVDRVDGPASWFEPGETVFATNSSYVFCPAVHRKQILRIFIRHFCEHPLLPDHSGKTRSLKEIRYDAVFEMYKFCEQRGLREVWGYMWTAWYCRAKYRIWARASQPNFIGRWRTTMAVENFWRNLKHGTLHHLLHPRLDQLLYLIATEPSPPFQKEFKKVWKTLELRALGAGADKYCTDVSRWTCSCGQQKYNAVLLCKHLVQAVHPPEPAFFREVVRRRVIPFYHHALLKPKNGGSTFAVIDGSISDGDVAATPLSTPAPPIRGVKRKRAAVPTPSAGSGDREDDPFVISSSSPIRVDEYHSDDDTQEFIKKRITELQQGINILQEQLASPAEAKIWLRSMRTQNIGQDITNMVADVRHFTQTGHSRPTTWAKPGDKKSLRYTQNTMGYHKK